MTAKSDDPGAPASATGADQEAVQQQLDHPKTPTPAPSPSEVIRVQQHDDGGDLLPSPPAPEPTQAGILLAIAEGASLFHTPDGTAYADLAISGHHETWPVRGSGFKHWLTRRYYELCRGAPNKETMQSALATIEAKAHFGSPERSVYVRVAELDGKVYLDLADDQWRAVEIDSTDWRPITEPPIRFRRSASMLPLPEPVRGGSIQTLRQFLNVATDADFVLAVAWLLAALRPRGPYPVLVFTGEYGSAKSTAAKMLRTFVDPHKPALSALPREERDLFIGAENRHVAAFDNISVLRQWISDAFCRLATGGGYTTRKLYTDQDETSFDVTRPIILNGIDDFVVRGDLADRSITIKFDPISDQLRRTEEELLLEFKAVQPAILGALLDAMVRGLRERPNVHLTRKPRMADFAVWATACEEALWPSGTFMAAYDTNRAEAVETLIEADTVATAVRSLMLKRPTWSDTATELMRALLLTQPADVVRTRTWPGSPRALSSRLRQAAPSLRCVGIQVEFGRAGHRRDRKITLTVSTFPSAQSSSSADGENARGNNTLGSNGQRTQSAPADATAIPADSTVSATVRPKPLKTKAADGADGADAKIPPPVGARYVQRAIGAHGDLAIAVWRAKSAARAADADVLSGARTCRVCLT